MPKKGSSSSQPSSAPPSPTKALNDVTITRADGGATPISRIDPSISSILPPSSHSPSPSTLRAAEEIKRKLVERLLKIDARLLKEVMSNSRSSPAPLVNLTPTLEYSAMKTYDKNKESAAMFIDESGGDVDRIISHRSSSAPPPQSGNYHNNHHYNYSHHILSPPISSLNKKHQHHQRMPNTKSLHSNQSQSQSQQHQQQQHHQHNQLPAPPLHSSPPHKFKLPKPKNYVRASPHENELMEGVLRVKSTSNTTLNRLRRKLIVRRMKRRAGIDIFDIDITMYNYLKNSNPLNYPDSTKTNSISNSDKTDAAGSDSLKWNVLTEEEEKNIPYIKNPALSFMAKMRGLSNLVEYFPSYKYPPEQVSPFTGERLPSYIERNKDICPPKLALLREIGSFWNFGKVKSEVVSPFNQNKDTIDFVHVLKSHIPYINRFLRSYFWPSIDMVEYLDYPDFGIVIMYKKMIIGCGFITPDAYITYMLIHPEWRGNAIGKRLLFLLLNRPSIRVQDVTLHVGIDNFAMTLYQEFGFKSEEFIENFYDKYYTSTNDSSYTSTSSKHAVFMRLRR